MLFMTTFQAIDLRDGQLKTFRGPNIEAIGASDARFVLDKMNLHYVKAEGAILRDTDGSNYEAQKLFN